MMKAIELIAAERQRQIEKEGFTADHDRKHKDSELALAAAAYAIPEHLRERFADRIGGNILIWWPWAVGCWKPTPDDRIRELTKAGALIAAEIDRLMIGGVNDDKNR